MSAQSLSRDVALRIGLAARVLPGIEPRRLVDVLVDRVGLPLTEKKLEKITVADLRAGISNLDDEEEGSGGGIDTEYYKQAVKFLWGDDGAGPKLPETQSFQEGDMPGSIRVACASNGEELLDGHFGSCQRFLVYQVSPQEIRLVELRDTRGGDSTDDKNSYRANLLRDCHVLYVQSIGGPAAAKVVKAGVHPIKYPEGGPAREVLQQLQQVLNGSPPPWLAKVMGKGAEERTHIQWEAEA